MISDICSVSFLVYTLLGVGSWSTDSWGVVPKLGECKAIATGVKISLFAMQTPIRQKRQNFSIPYYRPSRCRPCIVQPGASAFPRLRSPFPPPLASNSKPLGLADGPIHVMLEALRK